MAYRTSRISLRAALFAGVCLSTTAPAWAQEEATTEEDEPVNEIVVSATPIRDTNEASLELNR
ncbi:MAG: hypothetical protein AAFR64_02875 [Pseudomonadota bacterium]